MNFPTLAVLYLAFALMSIPGALYYASKRQTIHWKDGLIALGLASIWPLWWIAVVWDAYNPEGEP